MRALVPSVAVDVIDASSCSLTWALLTEGCDPVSLGVLQ